MTRARRILYSDGFWAAVFLMPNLLGFLVFTAFAVLASFGLSFTNWDLLGPVKWAGLANYRELLGDQTFIKVFWNTLKFTFTSVPVGVTISLFLAVALDQKISAVKLCRAAYFLPVISSSVAVAIVWQWVYNPEFGILNYILGLFGVKGPSWLTNTRWAMPAVIMASIWKDLGFNMMLFLAGLQGISDTYYEAAEIDGADWWARFRHITIPMLSPTTFFVMVTSVIGSFQVFDLVFVMTGGGPARSTSVLVHYLYQNAFQYFRMGYASAIAYVLFFLVLIITFIQLAYSRRWVVYQ